MSLLFTFARQVPTTKKLMYSKIVAYILHKYYFVIEIPIIHKMYDGKTFVIQLRLCSDRTLILYEDAIFWRILQKSCLLINADIILISKHSKCWELVFQLDISCIIYFYTRKVWNTGYNSVQSPLDILVLIFLCNQLVCIIIQGVFLNAL